MCGIFGFVVVGDRCADPDLAVAIRALKHRGPDDSGTYRGTGGGRRCGLAHTRLSILDLSAAGHQPMTTDDGRYTIVYNGEIYNFQEVRRELEQLGERFQSTGDTVVLLRAYARWGLAAIPRLRGMFAFGIWDSLTGDLVLARDRLGIKPLYYAQRSDGIVFSSEVRAMLATGAVPRKLSRRGLLSYLAFGSVAEPDTMVDAVSALPPGCSLRLTATGVELTRYWELTETPRAELSFEEAVEHTRGALNDAVRLRLIADVPVGVFLSGGVDSSVLVSFAARSAHSPLHTFTVTFDETEYTEAKHAASVAAAFGCTHHQVHLPASEAAADISAVVSALDQPSADGANTYFVAKAAKRSGLCVALSGLGGDELFAGYRSFRVFQLACRAAGALRPLSGGVLDTLLTGHPFRLPGSKPYKLEEVLVGEADPLAVYSTLRGMFATTQRRALIRADYVADEPGACGVRAVVRSCGAGLMTSMSGDPVNTYSALEMDNYMLNTLLRDTDAMSMAHALEVRVPLLDHVLVERVMEIPGALKLRRGMNKPLLRLAAHGIPSAALDRQKMGFVLPFERWFRGPLRAWLADAVLGETVRAMGALDEVAVGAMWQAFVGGGGGVTASRVWAIAALVMWCAEYGMSI